MGSNFEIEDAGYLRIKEQGASPSDTSGFGKLFAKSSDSLLYYRDDSGNEYNLTTSGAVIERTNVIKIIPSVTETVGKVYNTIANAQAYIDTQTRNTNNRWIIYVGQSSENFTVRSWEKIVGSNGAVLSGTITGSTPTTSDKFEIVVESAYCTGTVLIASGDQLMFSNCDARGGSGNGSQIGNLYGYQTTFSGGVWTNLSLIEIYHCFIEDITGDAWGAITFNSENSIIESIAIKAGTHYLSQFRSSVTFVTPFTLTFKECNVNSGNKTIAAGDTITFENCDLNNWTYTVSGGTLNSYSTARLNISYSSGTLNNSDEFLSRTSTGNTLNTKTASDAIKLGAAGAANSSAILQADSTTQGFLKPRVTTAQKNAIATPSTGLEVYDTDTNRPEYYNGSFWAHAEILAPIISPTAFTGDVNDYNPTGLSTAEVIRIDCGGGNREMTGLVAQQDGRRITILNISANGDLKLKNENASSTAANRFVLNGDLTIKKNGGAVIVYDATSARWRAVYPF